MALALIIKMRKTIIITVLTFCCNILIAQSTDSIIIYQNYDNYIQNPYLDSIKNEYEKTEHLMIHWKECPDYFFINSDGDSISLIDKVNQINSEESLATAYCEIFTDWTGVIREIKVVKSDNKINLEKLTTFFKGIKSQPLKRYGYGIDNKCIIKIKN